MDFRSVDIQSRSASAPTDNPHERALPPMAERRGVRQCLPVPGGKSFIGGPNCLRARVSADAPLLAGQNVCGKSEGRLRSANLALIYRARRFTQAGFSFFFRQYLVDLGYPIGGSLFVGESVDRFRLATPNNFHCPGKSGIAFSHFENRRLRHPANIRLCGSGVQVAIPSR
jgi:hypothetical protein